MAFKLKDLIVSKVDFVNEGANPDAHIKFFKNKKKTIDIAKSYDTFDDKMKEVRTRAVRDQLWDIHYALIESMTSILIDDECSDKVTAMHENVTQFTEAMADLIPAWCSGKVAECTIGNGNTLPVRKSIAENAIARLNKIVGITNSDTDDEIYIEEGDSNMKVNKSLLTEDERTQLEVILKKAGCDKNSDDNKPSVNTKSSAKEKDDEDDDTIDIIEGKTKTAKSASASPIYGNVSFEEMFPEMAAELEGLKAFKADTIAKSKAAEMDQLTAIAKNYMLLGKEPEDLAKSLKAMKDAGEDIYKSYISALDGQLAAVNKSKAFEEVGMNGHGTTGLSAIAKAKTKAAEIMKSNPALSEEQAMAKAWTENPELMTEYDNEVIGG